MGWCVRLHVWLRRVHSREFTHLPVCLRSESRVMWLTDGLSGFLVFESRSFSCSRLQCKAMQDAVCSKKVVKGNMLTGG